MISWNVNGLRAVIKKGLFDFLNKEKPDVFCMQEIKISDDMLTEELKKYDGYDYVYFNHAEKKGYSGTAILSKVKPILVNNGIPSKIFANEGRVVTAEFEDFYLVNVYTPNSQHGLTRLIDRMQWDKDFVTYLKDLEKNKPVVTCGDFNVAHTEIDLARPKDNRNSPGFTDEERSGFDNLVDNGFVDTFRIFNQETGNYTWWSYFGKARDKNVGWRIDYFCVSTSLKNRVKNAFILPKVYGSDHCPVGIDI